MEIKKYVVLPEEILVGLAEGKFIEGSLHRDKNTGRIVFNAYNRLSRQPGYQKPKEEVIGETDFGRVAETPKKIKVYENFPKRMGAARILAALDREFKDIKGAIFNREIVERV